MQTPADDPLVSVITIFLNARRFLGEAVESVRAQTYPHWELLLVDDGSTDGSSGQARSYAERQPDRIRYLEHEGHENRGMSATRNLGLARSRGAFLAFLDADDVWLPGKLEAQVAVMAAQPEAAVVAGPTRLWYGWTGLPEDAARDALRVVDPATERLYRPPELLRRFLADRSLTPATCSVLIRREALTRTGPFEERFRGLYEDQAFFLKAYLKLPIYLTSESLDLYRQHPDSHSTWALRTGRYSEDGPSPALTGLLSWFARYLLRQGVTDRAIWSALIGKLTRIGVHRAMNVVNGPAKRVIAWWYARAERRARAGSASD